MTEWLAFLAVGGPAAVALALIYWAIRREVRSWGP
jgi:hypothetical protein